MFDEAKTVASSGPVLDVVKIVEILCAGGERVWSKSDGMIRH